MNTMRWLMAGILVPGFVPTAVGALFVDGFESSGNVCAVPAHFASGLSPSHVLHVATGGNDSIGNGSSTQPFATVVRAAQVALPGAAIVIHPGTYAGGQFVADLRGTAVAPIWVGGMAGQPRPVIEGGSNGIQFSRPAYVVLHDILVRNAGANGINIDDGGQYADPLAAHHVVVERLDIRDIGGGGNQDCLKISGLNDFQIRDSHFQNCGDGGSGIDFVGGHRGLVHGNVLIDIGGSGVQTKGGSSDIDIHANRFINGGSRALNMGGSTGLEFFRPPLSGSHSNAEARRIRALSNLFVGSAQAPLNFVGCVDCVAAHNTIVNPGTWLVRVLQETGSQGGHVFEPTRNGLVQNNLFVFQRSQVTSSGVNVGSGTDASSFVWINNLFHAPDQPANSLPNLPGTVSGSLAGVDPGITPPDYRIAPDSPAAGSGVTLDARLGDLGGACFADPPSRGAWEADTPAMQ
ncbi:right-handed parallel beta-helix repeat-containing protein [Xanthomonadaceae bacterium JHOS43]|nr:right-handed parallel beta-helix repeat-containing protein [Xanthomonadaceae bacterium JHOS43]